MSILLSGIFFITSKQSPCITVFFISKVYHPQKSPQNKCGDYLFIILNNCRQLSMSSTALRFGVFVAMRAFNTSIWSFISACGMVIVTSPFPVIKSLTFATIRVATEFSCQSGFPQLAW